MRIIVVDSDKAFTTSLAQRCQKANVFCQVIPTPASAFAEIKKNPDNVDLILISKELEGEQDGLQFAQTIRKDPKTADVPYVLMSSTWGKAEFAKHQKTEFGANAYYNKKTALTDLDATIEAVTGFKFGAPAAPSAAMQAQSAAASKSGGSMLNIKLQAASDVVNISEDVPSDISMSEPISLFGEEAPAAAKPAAPSIPTIGAPPPKEPTVAIQLDVGGAMKPPPAPAAAPPAAPKAAAPEAPAVESGGEAGGIEIKMGGDFELETSGAPKGPAAEPEAKPPASKAPASATSIVPPSATSISPSSATSIVPPAEGPAGDTPQVEGSLFTIDFSGGDPAAPAAEVAAAAPAAKAAPEAPAVQPPAPPSGGVEISLDAAPAVAAPAVVEAPAAVVEAASAAIDIGAVAEIVAAAPPPEAPSVPTAIEAAPPAPEASAPIEAAPEAPPAPVAEAAAPAVSEEEAAKDLPYLFAGGASNIGQTGATSRNIVPPPSPSRSHAEMPSSGGAVNEDVETLKKYLTMREQDVSVLTAQLSYAKEELGKSEDSIKRLTLQNEDLYHQINDLKTKNSTLEQELSHASKNREGEVEQLRFEVKAKIDRIKFLEDRLNDSAQQYEKLKERVRLDIRKIRIREKELESKLEILKKDSETLISARENKILELKRKIDLLEFNYDTLQDKNEMERQNVTKANEKIDRVLKVLKLAVGVIEAEGEHAGATSKSDTGASATGSRPGEKVA